MNKIIFLLINTLTIWSAIAQTKTYFMPFQGFKVTEKGISCEKISATINSEQWTSNLIGLNESFKLSIKNFSGFEVNSNNNIAVGIEAFMKSKKGDTLVYMPNIFEAYKDGIDVDLVNKLSASLGLRDVSIGDTFLVRIAFYDLKSDRYLRVEGEVIANKEKTPDLSSMHFNYTMGDYAWSSSPMGCPEMKLFIDMSFSKNTTNNSTIRLVFDTKDLQPEELQDAALEMKLLFANGQIKTQKDILKLVKESVLVSSSDVIVSQTTISFPISEIDLGNIKHIWVKINDVKRKWTVAGTVKL